MKKNIIAIAVAAAMIAPAAAMADTTLYGKIHVSYDFVGGDNADNTTSGFSSNSSRIGIKGKEKINDSLSVIYQYETSVDWGTGKTSSSGGLGGQRGTFVGLTGGWGTVIAGRHDTPLKMMGRSYDLFDSTIGDTRNIISGPKNNAGLTDTKWDLCPAQTIAYVTPDLMGFKAVLAYINNWDPTGPNGIYGDQNKAYGASASYKIAGFGLDAAYEYHKNDTNAAPMKSDQSAYRLGANYSIAGFKILGFYQDIQNVAYSNDNQKAYGVGAAYTFMGANTIKAQYYKADDVDNTSDTNGELWAVGYDYKLSKQTSVYAVYAQTNNGANASYTIMDGGHGASYPQGNYNNTGSFTGGKSSAVSLGLVHKF
ncbi:porin [Halothiobacillus neapolitanus]|uniref:Porin Gram-negative type n=2 Tax=Halothiobacillus TaxID=109262 RepID=D0KVH6_HALNC|nr:porin [Halothiobacillus neapolitanus]ACX96806.1 porin Gram-negative type [Halothiobacillus neapolitanus c2]